MAASDSPASSPLTSSGRGSVYRPGLDLHHDAIPRQADGADDEDDSEDDNEKDNEDDDEVDDEDDEHRIADAAEASVAVETLVEHLLAAKRSLSSVALVLRANQLCTWARGMHEESVILGAQTEFLRRGIGEQVRVLLRVRRGMRRAYDGGKRDFKALIRTLDAANGRLEQTMEMLRETIVASVFRPVGEAPRTLLDFVDEKGVDGMRNKLKESLAGLQNAQQSFDGDLLRFDTDIRSLTKTINNSPAPPSPSESASYEPMPHLLSSLTNNSHAMAEHLTSLTNHFDMCVKAIRTTEGGAALALRKAAEATESQDGAEPISISGVIAEGESPMAELDPMTPQERAEIVHIVTQDAPEVDEVVAEMNAFLQEMETSFAQLREQAEQVRGACVSSVDGFRALEDVGVRLQSYIAAEAEFLDRWADERDIISARLNDMEEMRRVYEGYANAYDSLILEFERRRSVEEKIQAIWRKARDGVDKLIDADQREREVLHQEIGEYLPTDLWVGMSDPIRRWEVVPVEDEGDGKGKNAGSSTGTLDRSVVEAAKERLGRTTGGR